MPWSTLMVELLTTVVWPFENGRGWLTVLLSLMVTDSEPCETAAGLTVTLLLITTVPVRELMITRAGALAGSTCRFSTCDRKATRSVMSRGALHPDRRAVDDGGGARAHTLVDALDQAGRGGEIRIVEIQHDGIALRELRGHRAFHRRAVRDAAGARHVDRELRAVVGLHAEAADDQVALGDRVDLPVEPVQRRDQQRAAAQALGVRDAN